MRITYYFSRSFILVVNILLVLLSSCSKDEDSDSIEKTQQYRWAAAALDVFSIYRDRLPPNLYAFSTPDELYRYIGDDYTYFLNETYTKMMLKELLATNESGVGVRFDSTGSGFVIKDVFSDAPAEKAGIFKYDTILQINGKSLSGISKEEVGLLLLGTSGTSVQINVKRGNQTLLFTVTIGEYKSPTVFFDSINPSTAYIRLEVFLKETNTEGGSAQEFKNALQATSWAEYTIFDLRDNPGGMIEQCIDILGELVPPETEVMITSERNYDRENGTGYTNDSIYVTHGSGIAASRNIMILADSLSASASEILISCIKLNRPLVKLIGDTTYGKGIGQVILLKEPDSVMVSITSLKITRTDGTSYHKIGLIPDIAVQSSGADEVALDLIADMNGMAKSKIRNMSLGGNHVGRRVWKPLLIREIREFK